MKFQRHALAGIVLIASMLACNLPSSAEQVPPPSDAQTAAALTVEALMAPSVTATIHQETPTSQPNTSTPTVQGNHTVSE